MVPAFVIGNGISRNSIDLNLLKGKGITYGCNALYRDFTPDVLVALDNRISKEIQNSGYALKNECYCLKLLPDSGAISIEGKARGNTGATALLLAINSGKHDTIYLLGFDLGSLPRENNNCYAGTECYSKPRDKPKHVKNFKLQLRLNVIEKYTDVKYVRVINKHSNAFRELNNLEDISVEEFLEALEKM
jgi:hypothetical protein